VFVVSILYNSILKASIVFIKLSEDQVGETDFVSNQSQTNFLDENIVLLVVYC